MIDFFVNLLKEIWPYIEKFWRKIISFASDIVNYFEDPSIINQLEQDENLVAITIKDKLDNGEYNVVPCLFNREKNKIVDMKKTKGLKSNRLDNETKQRFGNEDMIVLQ